MTSTSIAVLLPIAVACLDCATPGATTAQGTIECEPALREMVELQRFDSIARFKQGWEHGWEMGWVLKSARQKEIDHFLSGSVLEWERVEGDTTVVRLDAFTFAGCIYSAHETVYQSGREAARGHLYLDRAGNPKYRALVYATGPAAPPSSDLSKLFDTSDILYYELEAFSTGPTG